MYWIYLNVYAFAIAILVKNSSLNVKEENQNRVLDFPIVNNFIKVLFGGSFIINNNNIPWIFLAEQVLKTSYLHWYIEP